MVARLAKVVQIFPLIYQLATEDFGAMELRCAVYPSVVVVVGPFLRFLTIRFYLFLLQFVLHFTY